MENNNGRGIFYGVIGVATLVVAIIGATFAYFSATTGRNDVLNVASTSIELEINGESSNILTDLIPVDAKENGTIFAAYPGLTRPNRENDTIGKGTCSDDTGNSICSVYQFTIHNPSESVSQEVTGGIKVTANSGFVNLNYALFKGSVSDIAGSANKFNVDTAAKSTIVGAANGDVIVAPTAFGNQAAEFTMWPSTKETLAPLGSTTYTVVVWLEEAGEANQPEMDQSFSAAITFTTGTGQGVTGVLSASS